MNELPLIPDAPEEFIGVLGDRRTGKTNFIVAVLYSAYEMGFPILSNFWLDFPHVQMTFSELVNVLSQKDADKKMAHLKGAYIGFDELSEGADAYRFWDKDATTISRFASQLGKLEMRVFYSEQRFNKIAKRLRDQTDLFFVMEKTGYRGIAKVDVLDANYHKMKSFVFDGRSLWGKFNTKEIINR